MIFNLLVIFRICDGIDLKCEFSDTGYLGKRCNLIEKKPILAGTEDEGYTFTDISNKQKKEVRGIRFYTSEIDFLPNETLSTFPNLNAIWIQDADLKVLKFDFLTNILKFAGPKITKLSLWNSGINQIDPRVISIFEKLSKVDLRGNECVNKDFDDRKEFPQMKLILENCINNFKTESSTPCKLNQIRNRFAFESDEEDEILQDEVSPQSVTLSLIKEEISEFRNEVNSELQKEIAEVNSELQKEIAGLKNQNSQIESNILSQISEIKQEISTNIEKQNSEIQSEIIKIKNDGAIEIESGISELKNNIMALKTEQDQIITQLKDEISNLHSKHKKLETDLLQR